MTIRMFPPDNYDHGLLLRCATSLHDLRAETRTSSRFTHHTKAATFPGEESSVSSPENVSLWRWRHITCIMSRALK